VRILGRWHSIAFQVYLRSLEEMAYLHPQTVPVQYTGPLGVKRSDTHPGAMQQARRGWGSSRARVECLREPKTQGHPQCATLEARVPQLSS
jgi:hypothetical protein